MIDPEPKLTSRVTASNPLLTSTAHFDLYPSVYEGPLQAFRSQDIWISEPMLTKYRRDWKTFAGDIYRHLPKAGVPLNVVDMVGDPVVIVLGAWGEIRMLHDQRGPRVLIRICVPEILGVALAFRLPDCPVTFALVMENIADANRRAHGIPKPVGPAAKPTPWRRRVYTTMQYLRLPPGKAWY
ncbi:MAG: hypothetical protein J0M02_01315 [Planctomycetes bacterium]|nr:hypothetical protein [Planctomycetota bacterium]